MKSSLPFAARKEETNKKKETSVTETDFVVAKIFEIFMEYTADTFETVNLQSSAKKKKNKNKTDSQEARLVCLFHTVDFLSSV